MKQQLINVLSKCIQAIKKLDENELECIRQNSFELSFTFSKSTPATTNRRSTLKFSPDNIINMLNGAKSREEGEKILSDAELKKHDLIKILKILDLPTTKRENTASLNGKIIEATIGYRLRSYAIQNKPL